MEAIIILNPILGPGPLTRGSLASLLADPLRAENILLRIDRAYQAPGMKFKNLADPALAS
jgi:hypothetical protein